MTSTSENNCISCGGTRVVILPLREHLTYYVCQTCQHCEKELGSGRSLDVEFEEAQEQYFGEDSAIHQVTKSPFEEEVLLKRANVISKNLPSRSCVLEVGPGGGAVLGWLVSNGHVATAVEHSGTLAQHLKSHYDIQIKTGEFEAFDFGEERFNALCSFHVIEHVCDPLAHLRKAFEVVQPGGLAFVATPNAGSWEHRVPGHLSPNYDSAHLRIYSQTSLSKLAQDAGWHIEQVLTPEYTSGWLRVASKMVRRFKGEHEEHTAGKYASRESRKLRVVFCVTNLLSWPLRKFQAQLGGGNELFFVLRKPDRETTGKA